MTGWAQETTIRQFAEMLDALVEQLGPDPSRRTRPSATSAGSGLTPEVGEKLHATLSAASRPDVDGEIRSSTQREADALDHLLDTVLDTALLPVDG